MTMKTKKRPGAIATRTPHAALADEVKQIEAGGLATSRFVDAPEAVPRAKESQLISIRLPNRLLAILKRFAKEESVGYQVLLKRWLDDRVREESVRLQQQGGVAPSFPLADR
jgi:predicted DNA binding CopG/RHH family protein